MLSGREFEAQRHDVLTRAEDISSVDLARQARRRLMQGVISPIEAMGEEAGRYEQVAIIQEGPRVYRLAGEIGSRAVSISGVLVSEDTKELVGNMERLRISAKGNLFDDAGNIIADSDPRLSLLKGDLHTGYEAPVGIWDSYVSHSIEES